MLCPTMLFTCVRNRWVWGFSSRYSMTSQSRPVLVLNCGSRPGLGRARQSKTKPPPLPLKSSGYPFLNQKLLTVTVSVELKAER